ncbi:MFS transporter [Serratia fonticola]|uniref:MFS transporter n=1 Tax=Serratia fonticola TaxID=47917 RepID=UPI002177CCD1|nr:MFS transporter [Serratia fonticola]CAI0985683.1 Inner membrane symporter yihP [Serratia fonticola]
MSEANQDPVKLILPLREKFAYGMGDVGSNLLLCVGTLYLLKFYTDVLGIPAAWGGLIFLISRFFTAFTDMGTGLMLDSRRNIGPKGKFRPFILYASMPVALLVVANFIGVGASFDVMIKTVIATLIFMAFGLFFSMMNCSYGAMVPAMTKNPQERAQLAAWRQGGATVGLLLCTVAFVPILSLFDGRPQVGYLVGAAIFAFVGMLCMWWCYSGVKERYVEIPKPGAPKPGLLQSFKAIAGNKPLFVLCVANLCTLAGFNIKLAIQIYYTQYVLNDITLLSYMGFFSMGCILLGVLLVPTVVKRFGKKNVYLGGLSLWILGDAMNYMWGNTSTLFVLFSCLAFFGTAFVNSLNWALVSDTVEYGEWKTGVRSEGTVYTGFTFFRKVSQGLAGFFPGVMLAYIGYVPNVAQGPGTLEGLRQLIFLYPCGLAVLTALTMGLFYHLTEKNYLKIVGELEERKRVVSPAM